MSAKKRSVKPRKSAGDALRELQKKSGVPMSRKISNPLAQPQNRWQRTVRYTWDKNRGRG